MMLEIEFGSGTPQCCRGLLIPTVLLISSGNPEVSRQHWIRDLFFANPISGLGLRSSGFQLDAAFCSAGLWEKTESEDQNI